jgi:subtilase family serine protease
MLALLLSSFFAISPLVAVNAPPCSGADPAIISATVQSTTSNGSLNHYTIAITVQNVGSMKQASNLLQSVDVYQDSGKVDQKGLQPLAPGKTQTVTYAFDRAIEAANHSTHLRFVLDFHAVSVPGNADCNTDNDQFRLDV